MSQVFKITLPNNDVRTSDLKDEVLNSLAPSPKINTQASPPHVGIIFLNWASSSLVIPRGTTQVLYSFPHGYNYVPTAIAVFAFDNGVNPQNGTLPFQYGALGIITIDTDALNVNLKYFSIDLGSTIIPPFTMQVRFYVMAERGYI